MTSMPPGPPPESVQDLLAQSSWLRRLARTLVAGEAAAEDLVQETWLAALRHPRTRPGAARPWLASIARHLAANFRRGEARRRERERDAAARAPEPESELDPAELVGAVEAQRVLAEAILRLDEPLRSAVVLRHLRGLDSRAIGRLQGVPAGTVRWRLKRALELLRADLDRRLGGRHAAHAVLGALARRADPTPATVGTAPALPAALGTWPVLAAAGALAAFGAWWGTSALGVRTTPEPDGAPLAQAAELAEAELEPAPRIEGLAGRSRRAPPAPEPARPEALRAAAERGRAPVRGQLRIARSGEILDEALDLRLRSGDLAWEDRTRSRPDGSFASTRAFPRGVVLVEVFRPAGDLAGEVEVFFEPASTEPCLVDVSWPNFVRGRMLDRSGQPLRALEGEVLQGRTVLRLENLGIQADGTFSIAGLSPGPLTLVLRRGFERHTLSTTVARGANELGDVVVPFRERVGRIQGRLRAPQGEVGVILVLTELASGIERRLDVPDAEFAFEPVPLADYRLTLLAYDGRCYAFPTRFVRPPAELEFVATGSCAPLAFRAFDGTEELACQAWVRLGGSWSSTDVTCEPSEVERWIVAAEGHRPAEGRALASRRVELELEPGWGCALFFRESSGGADPELAGPIAGVEVRADGVLVARSDAEGVALVSLPAEPARLTFGLAGWRALHDDEHELANPFDLHALVRE